MTSRFQQKTFVTDEMEQEIRRCHVWTPSKTEPWYGHWSADQVLTKQQLHELAKRGLEPDTERLDVHVSTSQAEVHVGLRGKQPWRRIPCPIVGRMQDGRLKVVAPNGDRKLVWPSGDIRKPWHWPGEKARIAARENGGDLPV